MPESNSPESAPAESTPANSPGASGIGRSTPYDTCRRGSLRGKTLFITGASRGIGKAIAMRAAADGANIVVAAKTTEPHPRLPGTIYSAVQEIEQAGGQGLACVMDVREDAQVRQAVETAAAHFGAIDILVNNASAIFLAGTLGTPMKRFDLMHSINVRGTFLTSQCCLPTLLQASQPHILNIAPPLNLDAKWFAPHTAYSIAKFGMSLCVLGMAAEFEPQGISVNALWPRTAIATAAVQNLLGGDAAIRGCRWPEIMADAAHCWLTQSERPSGQFCLDEEVLQAAGVTDFAPYAVDPNSPLMMDFWVDEDAKV